MSVDRRQAIGLIASAALVSRGLPTVEARAGDLSLATGRVCEPFLAFDGAEPAFAGGITPLADGGFQVSWQTDLQVFGRSFGPDGAPRGCAQSVVTGVTGAYDGYSYCGAAAPVALSDGTLVAFVGEFEGANAVMVARLDASGAPVGRPCLLEDTDWGRPCRCYASAMTGDRAIVVWTTRRLTFGSGGLHWRIVGPDAAPISPIRTLSEPGWGHGRMTMAVQGLDDGRAVIAYFRTQECVVVGEAFAQVVDCDGELVGEPHDLEVDTGEVALAALPHGAWCALWPARDRSRPFFSHDLLATRVFHANGTSEPRRTTQVHPDDDAWYGIHAVSAAATADGRILALVGGGLYGDRQGREIRALLLDAAGNTGSYRVLAALEGEPRTLRQDPTPLGLVRLASGDIVAHWRGCQPIESAEARSACLLRVA